MIMYLGWINIFQYELFKLWYSYVKRINRKYEKYAYLINSQWNFSENFNKFASEKMEKN